MAGLEPATLCSWGPLHHALLSLSYTINQVGQC